MSELSKSVLDLKPIVAEPHSTWGTTITLSKTRFVAIDMETLGTTNNTTNETPARQTIIEAGISLIAVLLPPGGII